MEHTYSPRPWRGVAAVPPSKSEAHRRMICAALSDHPACLTNFAPSKDMTATMDCLTALGAKVTAEDGRVTLDGASMGAAASVMDCGESGSTLRFMIPIALALGNGGTFLLHGRLGERPLAPYEPMYAACGVTAVYGAPDATGAVPYTVTGRLRAGDYSLSGNVSSQFVSGMLFALPLLSGDSTLTVTPPVTSVGYIAMTLQCLRESGIAVEELVPYTWRIRGNQRYNARDAALLGDWSQGAVLLCAAAMGQPLTVAGLSTDTAQGDAAVLTCLAALGAQWRDTAQGLIVTAESLRGATFSGEDIPDIVPVLALTCTQAAGESRITNCGRLRVKESDRFAATIDLLRTLGADIHGEGDTLVIRGKTPLHGGVTVDGCNDHRMVMLMALAATLCDAPVTVRGTEALRKSWPRFTEEIEALQK